MIDMIQLIKVENDCPAGVSKQTEILASSHIVEVDVTLYISYSTTHIISHTLLWCSTVQRFVFENNYLIAYYRSILVLISVTYPLQLKQRTF